MPDTTSNIPPTHEFQLEFGAVIKSWFDSETLEYLEDQAPDEIEFLDEHGNVLLTMTPPTGTRSINLNH